MALLIFEGFIVYKFRSYLIAFSVALTLTACGGGDGVSSSTVNAPVVEAQMVSSAKTVPDAVLAESGTGITPVTSGGVVLKSSHPEVNKYQVGDVLFIPPVLGKGLDTSFVGKVSSISNADGKTQVNLIPANVEDAYTSLKWDIDTAKTGASVVGVISPPKAKVSFSSNSNISTQTGLVIKDELSVKDSALEGAIKMEHELLYKGKKVVLFAEVDLSGVTVRSRGDFDVSNIGSDNGWAEFTAVVKGDLGAKIGLRAPDLVEVPTLADLVASQDVWADLKWSGSDVYKLEGLEGDDKKGRIPLGGVVLTPCPTGVCPLKFTGNLGNNTVHLFSIAPTAILWVYMDMSGKISISGEVGARLNGYHFEQGYEFKAVNLKLNAKKISVATPSALEIYGNATLDTEQRFGVSVGADILVGGIRPVAVNTFVGAQYQGKLEGDLSYAIVPPNGWAGYGCVESNIWAGVELSAQFRMKVEVPVDLYFKRFELGGVIERTFSGKVLDIMAEKDLGSSCLVSGPFSIVATVKGSDPEIGANALIDIDFSVGYNNENVRKFTDLWQIVAECAGCVSQKFEVPSDEAKINSGIYSISLPVGHQYNIKLQAKSDADADWVIREAVTSVSVGDRPSADFAVEANMGDCKNLKLTATAVASDGQSIKSHQWRIRPGGSTSFLEYGGSFVGSAILPSCGLTQVTLTVIDSAGFVTAVSRTIDTGLMSPKVTDVTPPSAVLNQLTTVKISGQNLPFNPMPAMTLGGIPCQIQSSPAPTASGFTAVCTPGGVAGNQAVSIKTVGGMVIDESKIIAVSPANKFPVAAKLNPTNGHYYELISCGTWLVCKDAAVARGGILATIRSRAENDWIAQNLLAGAVGSSGAWIGLTDEGSEGRWRWLSGESVAYSNWNIGEPSNSGVGGENYAHIYTQIYTWNDLANSNSMIGQAVVEYGVSDPFSPAVVEIPAASFVRGVAVALSLNGYGADALMNAPPYGPADNSAEWDIIVPATGQYELFATYASGESRPVSIAFNGGVVFNAALAGSTGGFFPANRSSLSQGYVQLAAGSHVMRVSEVGPNVFPHIQGFRLVRIK